MTPELHSMMRAWLESGDEYQKAHAAHRLSMPDAVGYVPVGMPRSPPTTLRAIPPILNLDPWLLKIRACPHFQPGCCHSPAPFCTRYNVSPSREMCIECLGGSVE